MSNKRSRKDRINIGNSSNIGKKVSIGKKSFDFNTNIYSNNANSRYKDDYVGLDGQTDMFNYSDQLDYGFDIKINDMSGGTTTVNSKNIERRNNYINNNRNNFVNDRSNNEYDSLENAYVNVDSNDKQYSRNKNIDNKKDTLKEDLVKDNALKEAALKEDILNNIKNNSIKTDTRSENKLTNAIREKLEDEVKNTSSNDINDVNTSEKDVNKDNNRYNNNKKAYNKSKKSSRKNKGNQRRDNRQNNKDMSLDNCTKYYYDMTKDDGNKDNINMLDSKVASEPTVSRPNSVTSEPMVSRPNGVSSSAPNSVPNDNVSNNMPYGLPPMSSVAISEPISSATNADNSNYHNSYNNNYSANNNKYTANNNNILSNDEKINQNLNKKENNANDESINSLNDSSNKAFDPFKESDGEIYDLDTNDFDKKDKTSSRYKRVKRMFILEAVMFVFMVLGIYALKFMVKYNGVLANKLDENEIGLENTVRKEGYRTIALYGIDADDEGTTRSDSIIVANINQTNGEVKLVAVYRDTYLYVPGWQEKSGSEFTKINAAYVVGDNDKQHVENAIKALNQNLALHITDYMAVNFAALAQIVDAIGGVEVNIPKTKNFTVYMNKFGGDAARASKAKYTKVDESILGKRVRLNGYQALGFCRVRKATSGLAAMYPLEGESDYTRSQRQREVINEIVKEIKKAGVGKLRDMLEVFQNKKNINTSFSWSDLIELASEGIKYDYRIVDQSYSFPQETHTVRIPGGENGQCVEFSNFKLEDEVRLLHKYMYPDKILTEDELDNVKKVSERLEGYKQSYDPEYSMSLNDNEKKLKEAYKKLENNESSSEDKNDKKKEDSKKEEKSDKDNSNSSDSKKSKKNDNE